MISAPYSHAYLHNFCSTDAKSFYIWNFQRHFDIGLHIRAYTVEITFVNWKDFQKKWQEKLMAMQKRTTINP